MNVQRCVWLALCSLTLANAHASDTYRHSTTLSVQADENDNQQWLGSVTLALGEHAWVQGALGTSEFAAGAARDTKTAGVAFGAGSRTVSTAIEFSQRKGDGRFEQQNWAATFDWRGARGGLGADVFLRSATGESQATESGGAFGSPATTTVRESVDGKGIGLHGDFYVTAHASIFAGAMRYRYDFDVDAAAPASTTPLSTLLGTRDQLAAVWREQAFIEQSYRLGGSYRFQNAVVTAQYFRDYAATTGEKLDTVQLQAGLPVAGHWLIAPMIGYSSSENAEQVTYGGLAMSFRW
jgi:hypothetical protein